MPQKTTYNLYTIGMKKLIGLSFAAVLLFAACGKKGISDQKELQEALIKAKPGDTIYIAEGKYTMTNTLSMDGLENVTLKGAGKDKTILNFKGQTAGAEGIRVSKCKNVMVCDFTVEDMKGDGFKAEKCDGIIFRRIGVNWSTPHDSSNGAYGLYPVTSKRVIIEDCEIANASDAGIYLGQSEDGIIRRNYVHDNVAGIEVENSFDIDVYENNCTGNTGGLLVFDLPDIPVKNGMRVRVYNNKIVDNNLPNFSPPANSVAIVPAGTGFFVMATSDVEVYNNTIHNNKTVNCGIISYLTTGRTIKDSLYNPYCSAISIFDNDFKRTDALPDITKPIGIPLAKAFGNKVPDIIYDGFIDPSVVVDGKIPENKRICVRNNKNATYANIDVQGNFTNITTDINALNCDLPRLKGSTLK